MTIKTIEIADCPIHKTTLDEKDVEIYLTQAYNLINKKYENNILIKISNWSSFCVNLFVSESPSSEVKVIPLKLDKFETFDLIQKVEYNVSTLTLEGYSDSSNHWLQYQFIEPKIDITKWKE